VASDEGEGIPMDGPISSGGGGGNSREEIEAGNIEYRSLLRQQRTFEKLVKRAPEKFAINYGTGRLVWPLPGYTSVSSPFGQRWGRLHAGIDVPAPIGTRIVAADAGTVILAGATGGYGNYTCIQHTKALSTCYGHQSRILVRPGDDVRAGQVIGLSGNTGNSTGPHLHFETRNNGSPFDPLTFF
jgi:murein DD-endopeptidase MepM/ murein hydrolase activator NlpD